MHIYPITLTSSLLRKILNRKTAQRSVQVFDIKHWSKWSSTFDFQVLKNIKDREKNNITDSVKKQMESGGSYDNLCYLEESEVSLRSPSVFCSVFGDPHIFTYRGRKQTCATLGSWPLVDNVYFTIQALNVPIGTGDSSRNSNKRDRESIHPVDNHDQMSPDSSQNNKKDSSASAITRVGVLPGLLNNIILAAGF